ncbi:MaoC/PaaZ C-terminal domain-containing protein [Planococcus ruber]|uniref:MaoC/PaaZ C-terminal domain-containing protein n=1 Tax=Planococcus ruber TaxID=2027871 RepID=UPI001FEDE4CE|nr:MaoC/PaaZ C-terminal domain-containing protein [Planococcus ruber]MCJ1907971.1 3-hydroxyacyl-ACP dehydratase [Planococcus ruber]
MNELPVIRKQPLKPIDLVKYSGASGDFNEIHTVPGVAHEKGLKDIIAHGMFLMGWAGEAIAEWFPDRKLSRFKVRFQAVTHPGSELFISGAADGNKGEIIISDSVGEVKLRGSFEIQ